MKIEQHSLPVGKLSRNTIPLQPGTILLDLCPLMQALENTGSLSLDRQSLSVFAEVAERYLDSLRELHADRVIELLAEASYYEAGARMLAYNKYPLCAEDPRAIEHACVAACNRVCLKLHQNRSANVLVEEKADGLEDAAHSSAPLIHTEETLQKCEASLTRELFTAVYFAAELALCDITSPLDSEDEFVRLLEKQWEEYGSVQIALEKTRLFYTQFYESSLPSLKNRVVYDIVAEIILRSIQQKTHEQELKNYLRCAEDIHPYSAQTVQNHMHSWIHRISETFPPSSRTEMYQLIATHLAQLRATDIVSLVIGIGSIPRWVADLEARQSKLFGLKPNAESADLQKANDYIALLDKITNDTELELFVKNVLRALGYVVEETPSATQPTTGIQIVEKGRRKLIATVECKTEALEESVRRLIDKIEATHADQGTLITNGDFALSARELAQANNITLVDGTQLRACIIETLSGKSKDSHFLFQ